MRSRRPGLQALLIAVAVALAGAQATAQVAAPAQPSPAAGVPAIVPKASLPFSCLGETISADRTADDADDRIVCQTKAFFDLGGGTSVSADRIELFSRELRLTATGNVVFNGPDVLTTAESAEFDLNTNRATFKTAWGFMSLGEAVDATQFVAGQEADLFFWGESIERLGLREYKISSGGFTTCVQPTPRWEMESSDIALKINDYAIARNMVLRVKNVPVLFLPFIYYPIQDDDRATGFLLPTYGTSTVRGPSFSNQFFWAINRSQDASFFHDIFTRTGQGFGSEYRYITAPGSFGTFRAYRLNQSETTYTDDGVTSVLPAEISYEVDIAVNHRLRPNLRAQATVDYFSSLVTRQLYYQSVEQASNRNRTISAGLTGSFGRLSTGLFYLRTETFSNATDRTEYGGTPRVTASLAPQSLFGTQMYASVNSEYAYLPYRTYVDGVVDPRNDRSLGRFEVWPMLRAPLSQLTFLSVNSTASYRSTYYSKSQAGSNTNVPLIPEPVLRNYLALRSDIIGPVLTKIWDTPDSASTERMKHVIEPTFAADYVTEFENQALVPQLTDTSDYVVGGALRLTYGITNRLFSRARSTDGRRGNTREFVTLGVQQTWYSDPRASRFDSTYVTYSGRRDDVDLSPIAVIGNIRPSDVFDANGRLEYDVSGNGMQSLSVGSSINGSRGSGSLTFSRTKYSPSDEASSYISGSARVTNPNNRLTGSYSLSWDISRRYIVSQSIMANYMAQCCGLSAEFQRYNFSSSTGLPVPSDLRFNVGFVLSGLGTIPLNFFGAFGGTN